MLWREHALIYRIFLLQLSTPNISNTTTVAIIVFQSYAVSRLQTLAYKNEIYKHKSYTVNIFNTVAIYIYGIFRNSMMRLLGMNSDA